MPRILGTGVPGAHELRVDGASSLRRIMARGLQPPPSVSVSRRGLFRAFVPHRVAEQLPRAPDAATPTEEASPPAKPLPFRLPPGFVLQVQNARCLAQSKGCTVCLVHCPVPGALAVIDGFPRVQPACTACGACITACPSPSNAFQLLPRSRAR